MIRDRIASMFLALALGTGVVALPTARADDPVSPAFTYQGDLRSAGTPVTGTRDLKFRLYDALSGGTQIGPEVPKPGVVITEGRFTVQLDFGTSPFGGKARWLEVDVSNSAGPPFTTLTPRQPLTATPYALYALNAPTGITASVDAQFSENDRSGWTHVEVLGDDACLPSIPLGFTFTGWGRADTTVTVSSNGLLFFGASCSAFFSNGALPSGISLNPFLAFFWDDLRDYGGGEYFEYATFGSAPGRVFNLYYRNRLFNAATCGTDAVNLMIAIHEGSNLIRVSYSGFSGCAEMRGSSATFGLQGPGGGSAQAFMVSLNAPILDNDASRQSISYQPPPQ